MQEGGARGPSEPACAAGMEDTQMLREFVDYHTGERHRVHKSKQRLARCRFVMLYRDPDNGPLPSKGLRLARIPGLDQPEPVPVYGLAEDSWSLEIACCTCHRAILNKDRVWGPLKLREARKRRAARIHNGEQPPQLLCAACDPGVEAASTSPAVPQERGKRPRDDALTPPDAAVGKADPSLGEDADRSCLNSGNPSSVVGSTGTPERAVQTSGAGAGGQTMTRATEMLIDTQIFGTQNSALTSRKPLVPPAPSAPPSRPDPRCPYCSRDLQSVKRLGRYWRKFGYTGVPHVTCIANCMGCCASVVNFGCNRTCELTMPCVSRVFQYAQGLSTAICAPASFELTL
jgi:hypothetical protein